MLKIGIIGCGTIGTEIAKAVEKRFAKKAKVIALSDIDKRKALVLSRKLKSRPKIQGTDSLIKSCDLVVEAASARISADIAKKALGCGKDVMLMSIGGLLRDIGGLKRLAEERGARLFLPSGALCGLDGISSASNARLDYVALTTKKPPKALEGAPFIKKNRINLNNIKKEKVIFEGPASEAVLAFPKNINVAATLSIAGIGAKKTKVRIVVSPGLKKNIHEISARGSFGSLYSRTENIPSPSNPKTSYLAVLSAIATLRSILENVKVG